MVPRGRSRGSGNAVPHALARFATRPPKTEAQHRGYELACLLERAGLEPSTLEAECRISQITVRRIMHATSRTEPHKCTLERIANACGARLWDVFYLNRADVKR